MGLGGLKPFFESINQSIAVVVLQQEGLID